MRKSDALVHWRNLPENADPMPHFDPIPYKSEGRSFGACGIRIDGSPAFIDAVLSRLKPLLAAEGIDTRLELTRKRIEPMPGKPCHKAVPDAEVCYIRRHCRGNEGAMMQAFLAGPRERNRARRGIIERYESALA